MKRNAISSVLLIVLLTGGYARAQSITLNPQQQEDVQRLMLQLQQLSQDRERLQQLIQPFQQQRGGGGRGTPDVPILARSLPNGAWWTNTALVTRLGLTDEQKAKIERAFENHRQDLMTKTELLQKEEAQLARLLEAEPLDRNGVLTQTDRVIQARGELERTNSVMTLEMRESLTLAQWMQLPQVGVGGSYFIRQGVPGARTGGPGQEGGRRGGGQRQR
jgi:hypothetical protein